MQVLEIKRLSKPASWVWICIFSFKYVIFYSYFCLQCILPVWVMVIFICLVCHDLPPVEAFSPSRAILLILAVAVIGPCTKQPQCALMVACSSVLWSVYVAGSIAAGNWSRFFGGKPPNFPRLPSICYTACRSSLQIPVVSPGNII